MLEVGFCKGTITPPIGTPLGGYEKRSHNSIGIYDDLYARCMLFHEPKSDIYIAIIVCDLLWVNYEFTDEVKRLVEEFTRGRVKAQNVVIHAIHTHSSQRIVGGLDFYYRPIRKKDNIDRGWYVNYAIPYLQRVIASTVWGALFDLKPTIVKVNFASTDDQANRTAGL